MHVCPERRPGRREEEKTAFLRLPRLLYWRGKKAVRVCSPPRGLSGSWTLTAEKHILLRSSASTTPTVPTGPTSAAHVPELAAAVPASKGGLKGKGKGRPTLANPAAKPKAAPIAKGAAEPAAAPKGRRTKGRAQSKRGSSASVCGASVWVARHPRHPAQGSLWNSGWRPRANFCFVV